MATGGGGGIGGAAGAPAGPYSPAATGDGAAGRPESRLEASNKAFESSAHARSETVPAHIGDTTPLTIINQMETTQKNSIGDSGQKILGGFAVHSDSQAALSTSGATGDVSANLSPHPGYFSADRVVDTKADSKNGEASAFTQGSEKNSDRIAIPNKDALQNKPLAELRTTFDQNNQRLEAVVGQNLTQLQQHFLGFHGANSAGIDKLKIAGEDGKSASVYVATSTERSNSPQEWIANTSQALDFATAYSVSDQVGKPVQGGGVAVIDMGAGSKSGKNFGVDAHNPADTQFWGTANKAGEAVEEVNPKANPEQLKGYLDPSRWADARSVAGSPVKDADSHERSRLAAGFARQAMVNDLLKLMDVN